MDDYLTVESLIIARLQQRLGNGVRVLTAQDLAGVQELSQFHPAVHLLLTGDNPTEAVARGRNQKIEQQWTVIVVTKSVKEMKTGAGARSIAGPLIADVMRALSGWSPGERFIPLMRTRTPYRPQHSPGGFFYFPVAFATGFVFNTEE